MRVLIGGWRLIRLSFIERFVFFRIVLYWKFHCTCGDQGVLEGVPSSFIVWDRWVVTTQFWGAKNPLQIKKLKKKQQKKTGKNNNETMKQKNTYFDIKYTLREAKLLWAIINSHHFSESQNFYHMKYFPTMIVSNHKIG